MNDANRIIVPPDDQYNQELVNTTHPPDWKNPEPPGKYNLVVIGAGPAGLVAAAGAAGLGARVALIERFLMGGDCTTHGCVPSKAIIRSAKTAAEVRDASQFGVTVPDGANVNFAAVMERVRKLRAKIGHHDAAQRFSDMGIDIYLGEGAFTGSNTIEVAGKTLTFSKACIATGARAMEPPIEGLEETGFHTNETVFDLTEQPKRMVVVGGGPIGCELAQSFQRLGTQVTLIEMAEQILIREDQDAALVVREAMNADGVEFVMNAKVKAAKKNGEAKVVVVESDEGEREIETDAILIGVGRKPNVEGLNLEAAGIKYDPRTGIEVDDTLRTSNQRVYGAGDCCMAHKFTHTADAAAAIVLQNALFGFLPTKKKLSALTVPWCTYTEPEIAHVGFDEKECKERGIEIETFQVSMEENDRAICDGATNGLLKVFVKKGSDTIVGAICVAPDAGNIISEITTAMMAGKGLNHFNSVIHPYPTQAEVVRQVASQYRRTQLTPTVAKVLGFLMRIQR